MAASNKWLMSRIAYYLDFFTAPLFIIASFCIGGLHPVGMFVGLLIWSLVEYLVHRFLFHSLYRREHWTHHVDTLAYIGVSSWRISSVYVGLLWLASLTGLTSVYAGFVFGYFMYIFLHYVMHRPYHWAYRFILSLVANHDLHHRTGVEKNFGVSSPLWDHLFRTYSRVEISNAGK